MNESIRLSKRLIEIIACSRGEADKYIEGGWVLVDGVIVDEPQFKVTTQKVELHPDATLAPVLPATILINSPVVFEANKPIASLPLITPETRSPEDRSGIRLLKRHFARLTPTVPLEAGATGLLVFSQDRKIIRRLVEDANRNEQEYVVEVSGEIFEGGLERLNKIVKRNGKPLPSAKVSWQNENRLRFALKNPQPGQLAFMCKAVGLKVVSMTRIRIGRISMSKLPSGQWRYLAEGKVF